ncbi:MAG: branched-chain amino acid transaminase [Lachnospiraceae bacterium]|nr:branched-chain amino acid transaminase [Lachnospiraceae bacterium]
MDIEQRLIWLNGEIVNVNEAKINVLAPTAQFGANVFEGIRAYWNFEKQQLYAFRLEDHYKRLMNSIKVFRLNNPYSVEMMKQSLIATVRANQYKEDIQIRQTVFVEGMGSWFSTGPIGMFIAPIPKERKNVPLDTGMKAMVSSWDRICDSSMSPKIKVGANYINSRMAHLEARENGYDTAIFMNRQRKIAEGTGSCLFVVRDKCLITPPVTASILESITRDTILNIAEHLLKCKLEVRDIDRTELYIADEVFLCGSAAEVTPILNVDGYIVGDGNVGLLTQQIHQEYIRTVTGENHYNERWLTPIYDNCL